MQLAVGMDLKSYKRNVSQESSRILGILGTLDSDSVSEEKTNGILPIILDQWPGCKRRLQSLEHVDEQAKFWLNFGVSGWKPRYSVFPPVSCAL